MNKQPAGLNRSSGRMWPNENHWRPEEGETASCIIMALLSAHVRGTAEFLVRHKDKSRRTDGRCWRFLSCDGQLMFAGQRRDVTDVLVLATARPQSHPLWRSGRHVAKRLACWFSLLAFFLSSFFLSFSAVLWQHGGKSGLKEQVQAYFYLPFRLQLHFWKWGGGVN